VITSHFFRRCRPLCATLVAACAVLCVLVQIEALPQGSTRSVASRAGQPRTAAARGEVRALWVARTTLVSPDAIVRMVKAARAAGFNTLLVQVRARGEAYYARGLEPRAQALARQPSTFDPLAFTLTHARQAGLRVHAWINVNLVSSAAELPSAAGHVVFRHPEWLMVPRAQTTDLHLISPRSPLYLDRLKRAVRQQSADIEGLYLSPIDPAAAAYTAAVVRDIVARYAVDGVHLDYVRYPNDDFDYSQRALELFGGAVARTLPPAQANALRGRARTNPFAWTEAFPERWRDFRRARLTALVERLRAEVKQVRPQALISAAVAPDAVDASERRLQEWQRWTEDGLLDVVCPMAYATDLETFTAQVSEARQSAGGRPVWAGIGAYRLSPSETIETILAARRLGVAGVILFSYDSLTSSSPTGDSLKEIGKAVF
jgi:uncharacterized lipoprotein YddW (UPF0748 family)